MGKSNNGGSSNAGGAREGRSRVGGGVSEAQYALSGIDAKQSDLYKETVSKLKSVEGSGFMAQTRAIDEIKSKWINLSKEAGSIKTSTPGYKEASEKIGFRSEHVRFTNQLIDSGSPPSQILSQIQPPNQKYSNQKYNN